MGQTGQDVENEGDGTSPEAAAGAERKQENRQDNRQEDKQEDRQDAAEPVVDQEKIALQGRVQELEARLRTVSAAFRERQDEVAGIRERLTRQAQIEEEIRRGEVVTSLFEPVENLSRSIKASKNLPEETLQGLRMIHQAFMQALHKLGLEEVPGAGSRFDPAVHEAIATIPATDSALDNTVAQVFSTGYRIGKRLVCPARVVIHVAGES